MKRFRDAIAAAPLVLFAFMALPVMPATVKAQAANTSNTATTDAQKRYQEATAKINAAIKRYRQAHKAIRVQVDYVNVSRYEFLRTSQWIASGEKHDALLMAALVKAGAQDINGGQITSWDQSMFGTQINLQEKSMGNGVELPENIVKEIKVPVLVSYIEATPQFNADGTIKILLRLMFGSPAHHWPPTSAEGYQCVVPTFQDGQTLLVQSKTLPVARGASQMHLTFVRATTAKDASADANDGLPSPSPLMGFIIVQ